MTARHFSRPPTKQVYKREVGFVSGLIIYTRLAQANSGHALLSRRKNNRNYLIQVSMNGIMNKLKLQQIMQGMDSGVASGPK